MCLTYNSTKSHIRIMILLVSIIIVALPVTAGAQTWTEVGDAGDMIATASISSGSGPLP